MRQRHKSLPEKEIKEGMKALFVKDGNAGMVRIANTIPPHEPGQRTSIWVLVLENYFGALPLSFFARLDYLYSLPS